MLIAIPSKGRAGRVTSLQVTPSGVLFVPAAEVNEYEKAHPEASIVPIPDDVKGITKTRNWILRHAEDRYVVMVDDDVKEAGWLEHVGEKVKRHELGEAEWLWIFEDLFNLTEDMGFKIWGVKTENAPRSSYPFKPFMFYSYVTASCMGIINDGEYLFDEAFTVKEDYEICLRHIRDKGGILAARHVHWTNEHWTTRGGCADYRTQTNEREAIQRLMDLYPGMVRQVNRGGSRYSVHLDFNSR